MGITESLLLSLMLLTSDLVIDKNAPYWSDKGWRVLAYDDEDTCDIGIENMQGQYMTIGFYPKTDGLIFMVTNANATSLADGDKVKLTVAILESGEISNIWEDKEFVVRNNELKGVLFVSYDLDTSLLEGISKGELLAVISPQGKAVATFRLDNATPAVEKLRTCAFEMGELNPNDPFLP